MNYLMLLFRFLEYQAANIINLFKPCNEYR